MEVFAMIRTITCYFVIFSHKVTVEARATNSNSEVGEFVVKDGRTILIKGGIITTTDLGPNACDCYCKEKWTETVWVCCSCQVADGGCFPSTATVTSKSGDLIKMADLGVGEPIMTVDDEGAITFSEVLGFLHRSSQVTNYLTLETDSGQVISLSKTHLIFTKQQNDSGQLLPRFASTVSEGDAVLVSTGSVMEESTVRQISETSIEGAYVPLTAEGTLVVDGVYASCYASFPHQIAHYAMMPARWFPWLMYTTLENDGVPSYVQLLKSLGRTLLPYLTL